MALKNPTHLEWLESDGLGGFASGTASLRRTRRYHAILLTATEPPVGRMVLVNGFDASLQTSRGEYWLSSQLYAPDVVAPDGAEALESFEFDPWPRWKYRFSDGTLLEQELFVPRGSSVVALRWRLLQAPEGEVRLHVRPFLSGRGYHMLHRENPDFLSDAEEQGDEVTWRPYGGVPSITAKSNGSYTHQPAWYRHFLYERERDRGLDDTEDLMAPGIFGWNLEKREAILFFAAEGYEQHLRSWGADASAAFDAICDREQRRRGGFASALYRAADSYIVAGRGGKTILAGFPWFTDWGRDTFIALRGLCLATGRLADAREILLAWSDLVDRGMMPNRFPDRGTSATFNSVDASLWYIIACHDFFAAMARTGRKLSQTDRDALHRAIEAILAGYVAGTRYQIGLDAEDGLLAAGESGVQLTWMDAKVGDWVVTPRIGKPVEIQALWLNALTIGAKRNAELKPILQKGLASFAARFWNDESASLYDVVDVDHVAGTVDAAFRPNQIFAVGGLPEQLIEGKKARQIVDAVEARLWTRLGLRSLAPDSPDYAPHYEGGVHQRDGSYHQGTVWPWLCGAFIEAWVRVRGNTADARRVARERFLPGFEKHLEVAGLGHISEIADGDAPHTPRGCPAQAWSLGELLHLREEVLLESRGAIRGGGE